MQILYVLPVPLAFFYYLSGLSDQETHEKWFSFLAGFVVALPALFISFIFGGLIPADTDSFIVRFLRISFTESIIPYGCGIALLVYLQGHFRTGKADPVSLLFGIATFYLPYIMFNHYVSADVWAALFIPLMLLSILFIFDYVLGWTRSIRRYASSFLSSSLFLPAGLLLLSDLAKTLWYFAYPLWTWGFIGLLIVAFALVLRLIKYLR